MHIVSDTKAIFYPFMYRNLYMNIWNLKIEMFRIRNTRILDRNLSRNILFLKYETLLYVVVKVFCAVIKGAYFFIQCSLATYVCST